jgi:uncharacterized protein (DUF169 family)
MFLAANAYRWVAVAKSIFSRKIRNMAEVKTVPIGDQLSQVSGSEWIAIRFDSLVPIEKMKPLRFCEAVHLAQETNLRLNPYTVGCDGARRCFGWLKDFDLTLAQRLSMKTGISSVVACELIKNVPFLPKAFSGISLGRHIEGDVYISYASPESAMRLVRHWQKKTGENLAIKVSTMMSVCGNIAVKSYVDSTISVSFGCPDSREFGGIQKGQLVIGVPERIARVLCSI